MHILVLKITGKHEKDFLAENGGMNLQQDQFTKKSQLIINGACRQAEQLGHSFIGSEHLILSMLTDSSNVAAAILRSHRITLQRFRQAILEELGCSMPVTLTKDAMTPALQRILEKAASSRLYAGESNDRQISSEHLLLALLSEEQCGASVMLRSMGVSPAVLRNACTGNHCEELSGSNQFDRRICPMLAKYTRNMTDPSAADQFDPLIGRDEELRHVVQILLRRSKNNPVLIGEAGVGKTAIVEGLAKRITEGRIPFGLRNCILLSVDLTAILAGAKYRGDFEERLKSCIDEAAGNSQIILFIDEMHMIAGTGAAEGAIDAANILKPRLARGELRLIGATTEEEYRKMIAKDAALNRRFQAIRIKEPTPELAVRMLSGLRSRYENFHGLEIGADAINAAVRYSIRYLHDRALPDKALDLIDEACAAARLQYQTDTENEWCGATSDITVHEQVIAKIVSEKTGVPVGEVDTDDTDTLLHLEERLSEIIIGQDEAIRTVSKAIRRSRSGLRKSGRPAGCFLFLGASGIGKTMLAQKIAELLFGGNLIRIDMSEYMEQYSVSRLTGAPPGYVGYDECISLAERVRRNPYCVILFDEMEKAHPDVLSLLLQIMEDGVFTDAQGSCADFSDTFIILTSNLGTDQNGKNVAGFRENMKTEQNESDCLLETLRKTLRPELLNRLDQIIVFRRPVPDDYRKIAILQLEALKERAAEVGCFLQWDAVLPDAVAAASDTKNGGARSIRTTVLQQIEPLLADRILQKETGELFLEVQSGKFLLKSCSIIDSSGNTK